MRTLSSELQSASVQPVVNIVMLTRIDFDSGTVAWSSGYRGISLGGVSYEPIAAVGSISPVKESPGAKASGITITLSGIKPELVSLLQAEPCLNRKVLVHMAVTDEHWAFDYDQIILYFSGKIDSISGQSGATASLSIAVRSRLADWERTRNLKYTDADQQKLHPGDKGMEFIAQLSQKKIIWPKAKFLPDPRD